MTYEQTEQDFHEIERARDLPPDELHDGESDDEPYDHDEDGETDA